MNRPSFERWIFQNEAPPQEEVELLGPSPGFSRRWLRRWKARQLRAERVRAFWLASLSGIVLLLGAWFLLDQSLPVLFEPSSLLTGLVNVIVDFFAFLTVLFRVSSSLVRVTPSSVWLALASIASFAALVSVLALSRFVTQKGALQ